MKRPKITHSKIAKFKLPKLWKFEPKPLPSYPEIVKRIEESEDPLTTWQIVWFIISQPIKIIRLILKIVSLINRIKNMAKEKSKTSVAVTIKVGFGILAAIFGLFGIGLPEGTENAITGIAAGGYFLFSLIQGIFTKDDKKDAE